MTSRQPRNTSIWSTSRPALQELAAICDAMLECIAIVYSPLGRNELNASLGTLKGTSGQPRPGAPPLLLSHSNWNPRAVLLVREGAYVRDDEVQPAAALPGEAPATASDGSASLSGGAIAGIAIAGAAAGVLVAALTVLAMRRVQRVQRQHGRGQPATAAPNPLLPPVATKRASSGEDCFQLNMPLAHGQLATDGTSAVVQSPAAAALTTPRHRAAPPLPGSSPLHPAALAVPTPADAGADPDAAAASSRDGELQVAPAVASVSPKAHALAWAAELLAQQAPDWEEVVVEEAAIRFLTGPDGSPICLGGCAHILSVLCVHVWRLARPSLFNLLSSLCARSGSSRT